MQNVNLENYGLSTNYFGRDCLFFPVMDSTNEYVKNNLKSLNHGQVVCAGYQEKGRGRNKNSWFGEKDKSLLFTLLIKNHMPPKQAVKTVFIIALAVKFAIKNIYNISTEIKWPNDIYYNGKKIAGILTGKIENSIIIGVGLNVNQKKFIPEIANIASSLYLITNQEKHVFNVLAQILNSFEKIFSEFQTTGFEQIKNQVMENFYLMGKEIKVTSGTQEYTGICRGMNNEGELILETQNGLLNIPAGEVHICL